MNELARELGSKPGWRFTLRIVAMFASTVCFVNLFQAVAIGELPRFYIALHGLSWGCWFAWQGLIFPRARQYFIGSRGLSAYPAAFYGQIWPGVCWGLSHLTLPILLALRAGLNPGLARGTLGVLITVSGITLLSTGFHAIGFARAGFLDEYKPSPAPLCREGIYSLMRHPLFVGGVLISVGLSLLSVHSYRDLFLPALNVLILPIYARVEDYRLRLIFGATYGSYAANVAGIFPRLGHLAKLFVNTFQFSRSSASLSRWSDVSTNERRVERTASLRFRG